MSLFNFGKKKPQEQKLQVNCACGNTCDISKVKNARFIVLGACCQKSEDTFSNVKQAVLELGFSDQVINIGDFAQIAQYGVMQTPAFVIDSKVVSYGKLISVSEAKILIEKTIPKQ